MSPFEKHWSLALDRLLEAVVRDPQAEAEYARTRSGFARSATGHGEVTDGDRRHLEWFLLERPSDALGGVPLDVLRQAVLEGVDEGADKLYETFRASSAGVFEVTSLEAENLLWCRDLLSLGEYPVREPAVGELAVGDLLVGRLYPRDGHSELSPAVGVFRDRALASAVRADLESARKNRRNTLRMTQEELERLFFGGGATPESDADPLAELVAAGLAAPIAEGLLAELNEARTLGESPTAITELLNRLAFETECDLGAVQRTLLMAWSKTRGSRASKPARTPVATRAATANEVLSALRMFDEGRERGQDLEVLFQNLERELGLDDEEPLTDDDRAPDFPGVVGAVIDEFLWELSEREGERSTERFASLRLFAEFAARIGVFEELSKEHAVEFFTRWLPNHPERLAPEQWSAALHAFEVFAEWVENSHHHPLHSQLESDLPALSTTLHRLEGLASVRESLVGAERFDVLAVQDERLIVRANDGEEREFRLDTAASFLPGDRVELELVPPGRARVGQVWPVLRAR